MPGLILHTSNRLERLADGLAEVLRRPLHSPLAPETIVVQSQGMARWLKLELARRNGLWANSVFPFPNAFCHQIFQALRPAAEAENPFTREVMTWRILGLWPRVARRAEFAEVANYLGPDPEGRKGFQLAARLASLFDQYLVHRPELITAWDAGADAHWQAALWREVAVGASPNHLPAQFVEFAKRLAQVGQPDAALPERVSVFGVSSLPEFHLAVLGALARRIDVHCFLLQPSREYWGRITSPREQRRILKRAGREPTAAAAFHLETGNRLLAAWGRLGRDFLNLILEAGDWAEDERFVEPAADTLLHTIQTDIFQLHDRGRSTSNFGFRTLESGADPAPEPASLPKTLIRAADQSVMIHSCHGPLREMEVLYDHLLDWFERDPTLAPRDVLVLTPDIEAYAPFIQAVFAAPEDDARRIPFSLADRTTRRESSVVDTFLRLLRLPDTRLTAPEVLAPLETPAVRARFGLAEAELDLVRRWVSETNIRWGRDAAHRTRLGLPDYPENTWRHGLDRLLLGYAMAGRGEQLFAGVLPYDDVEGAPAETLGRFCEYAERLFALSEALRAPRPVAAWERVLSDLLNDFFADDDTGPPETGFVRAALRELRRRAQQAGFDGAVPLAVMQEALEVELREDRHGSGFLTGGVTFCALKPMRSLPFRIICVVGLNDGAFPRSDARLAFDLMAQHPKLGDRSVREDDRYLFLETLLSARDRLYLSYVGQSQRDNRPLPPSVLVSELLDYVKQGFSLEPDSSSSSSKRKSQTEDEDEDEGRGRVARSVADHLVTQHRLQAFSPAYFDGRHPRLFSFSAENCAASRIAGDPRQAAAPFFTSPLTEPEPEFRALDLARLAEFFCNPAKFLLRHRLGLKLPFEEAPLEDREPFTLDALQSYDLRQELVEARLGGADLAARLPVLTATGRLPAGASGALGFRRLRDDAEEFVQRLAPHLGGPLLAPLPLSLAIGPFRLTGQVGPRTARGLVSYRCAELKAKDHLRHWLRHLAWCAANLDAEHRSVLAGRNEVVCFRPVADATARLAELLELYWQGLGRPLPFFPESALAFVAAELRPPGSRAKTPPEAAARQQWEGRAFSPVAGEREDAWFALGFRHRQPDPLDAEFVRLARQVFQPLLAHREEVNR